MNTAIVAITFDCPAPRAVLADLDAAAVPKLAAGGRSESTITSRRAVSISAIRESSMRRTFELSSAPETTAARRAKSGWRADSSSSARR